MLACAFPGSFNPFHEGHAFVIESALKNGFDKVFVIIAINDKKQKANLKKIHKNVSNYLKEYIKQNSVEVIIHEGMVADLLWEKQIYWIVRGYRNDDDLKYEKWLYYQYIKRNTTLRCRLFKSPPELSDVRSSKFIK